MITSEKLDASTPYNQHERPEQATTQATTSPLPSRERDRVRGQTTNNP